MTTTLPSPTPTRTPLPSGPAVYQALSTDHYPWTELMADLEQRQAQAFSGVCDVRQGARWARFVLGSAGQRGFTTGGQAVSWAACMQAMPRARVSLTPLDAGVCDLVWAFRAGTAAPRRLLWPAAQPALERERFTGALSAPSGCSYWLGGVVLAGKLPAQGEPCLTYEPDQELDRSAVLAFWQEVMTALAGQTDLPTLWAQSRVLLTRTHPCLDPFAQEVHWDGVRLQVEGAVRVRELNAAMTDAVRLVAQRGAVRLSDLPLGQHARRAEWAALVGRGL